MRTPHKVGPAADVTPRTAPGWEISPAQVQKPPTPRPDSEPERGEHPLEQLAVWLAALGHPAAAARAGPGWAGLGRAGLGRVGLPVKKRQVEGLERELAGARQLARPAVEIG